VRDVRDLPTLARGGTERIDRESHGCIKAM